VNTVRLRNKDDICATDEKSTFHDSNHSPDPLFEPRWISDRTEAAVENAVSAVSDEGLARRPQTQPDSSAEDLESRLSCFQPERDDLYRNRCVRTQSVDQLGAVHMIARHRLAAATIFSRSNAPPSPLMRLSVPRSTSSAPSIVRS